MLDNDKTVLRYSDVNMQSVSWLWYPFIPYGKLTLIQGDPGEGKSMMILDIAASVSTGRCLPGMEKECQPLNVIYQCSEDGIEDTIKPRLVSAGADCSHIAFVNEEIEALTLSNDKLRSAIADFNASLVVIDPFQAYLGDSDLTNAMSMRKVLHRLGLWAGIYNCAIVLIGHLNKNENSKSLYRGLGSIDVAAASRSILQVSHLEENTEIKCISQIKNSLARKGSSLFFSITSIGQINWLSSEDYLEPKQEKKEECFHDERRTKKESAVVMLKYLLSLRAMEASEVFEFLKTRGISERTVSAAKKELGAKSYKKGDRWFWEL